MAKVQGILNSRLLTPVSNDRKDLEPLTRKPFSCSPGKYYLGTRVFAKEDTYCKRRWRQMQYISDIFWKRWLKEYLPTLQLRQKWCNPRHCFAVNDLVLVMDGRVHRGEWLLARVVQVHRGSDGNGRSSEVRTKALTLVRPISKLCFLEHVEQQVSKGTHRLFSVKYLFG